jgi:hypothetical protein
MRTVTYYDLCIRARGKSRAEGNIADFPAEPKTLKQIFDYVFAHYSLGDNFLWKSQGSNPVKIIIKDLSLIDGYYVILVNRSDPTVPDFVTSNPELNERKVHEKPQDHGGESSAHVLLKPDPIRGKNYYYCMIECSYGSGLTASGIAPYIAHIIRRCKKLYEADFRIDNPDGSVDAKGNINVVHLNHEVELQGHPSASFIKDIEQGTLSGIELIAHDDIGNRWDESGFVKERRKVIEMELEKDLIGDTWRTLNSVLGNAKKRGLAQMRVKFVNSDGETKDALISTDTGHLADDKKYVKKHRISDANTPTTTSFEQINNPIIKEILKYS